MSRNVIYYGYDEKVAVVQSRDYEIAGTCPRPRPAQTAQQRAICARVDAHTEVAIML